MADQPRTQRPWAAIAAVTVLTLPLGSIYSFSVFLKPIEAELGIPRSALSLVFGLATIGFTIGMNLAPVLYRLASPAKLVISATLLAAIGIEMASRAGGLPMLLLGYSMVFGIAGGTIFIILQQAANLLVQETGLLNGYILGLYPIGAMIATPLFGWSNEVHGYRVTLTGLAMVLLVFGGVSGWLTTMAGATLPTLASKKRGLEADRRTAITLRLCLVFFLAAAAGLTVLSQAVGIIAAYGGTSTMALWATTGITAVIACGRVSGGWLVDQFAVPVVSSAAHMVALTGTIILSIWPSPTAAIITLAMIGAGYGLVSGSTAGAVAVYWPKEMYGRIAGRVYIAWCVAAVTLPVLAGHLFDLTGGYVAAVLIAGCGNLLGCIVALGLPRRRMSDGITQIVA